MIFYGLKSSGTGSSETSEQGRIVNRYLHCASRPPVSVSNATVHGPRLSGIGRSLLPETLASDISKSLSAIPISLAVDEDGVLSPLCPTQPLTRTDATTATKSTPRIYFFEFISIASQQALPELFHVLCSWNKALSYLLLIPCLICVFCSDLCSNRVKNSIYLLNISCLVCLWCNRRKNRSKLWG